MCVRGHHVTWPRANGNPRADAAPQPALARAVLQVLLTEHPALGAELLPLLEALDAGQVVDVTNIGVRGS